MLSKSNMHMWIKKNKKKKKKKKRKKEKKKKIKGLGELSLQVTPNLPFRGNWCLLSHCFHGFL
jgi:hypothetical protein